VRVKGSSVRCVEGRIRCRSILFSDSAIERFFASSLACFPRCFAAPVPSSGGFQHIPSRSHLSQRRLPSRTNSPRSQKIDSAVVHNVDKPLTVAAWSV